MGHQIPALFKLTNFTITVTDSIINDKTSGEYTPAPRDMEVLVADELRTEKHKAQAERQREVK